MDLDLLLIFLAGFLAAGVDGALGMGFGPTASVMLLGAGLSPAAASATVNVAKIGSGLAGGAAHWRFGNVDRRLALSLAVPGAFGAVIGGVLLTTVDPKTIRPFLALALMAVGVRILWRMRLGAAAAAADHPANDPGDGRRFDRGTSAVGGLGGCTNTLVGAWGPVVTPYLLHRGVSPRMAIGSANTAEVAVAVVSVGVLVTSGPGNLDMGAALAMVAGGVLAAPIAAHLIRRIPSRAAGLALAAMLLLTQARELAGNLGLGVARWALYAVIAAAVALTARPMRRRRRGEGGLPAEDLPPTAARVSPTP